jgi:hypothetical protein
VSERFELDEALLTCLESAARECGDSILRCLTGPWGGDLKMASEAVSRSGPQVKAFATLMNACEVVRGLIAVCLESWEGGNGHGTN